MTRALALAAALVFATPVAHAVDSMSVEVGTSDSSNASVDLVRLGLQWNMPKRVDLGPNWQIAGFWDVSLGYWSNDSYKRSTSGLGDLGVTPVFRLQQTNLGGIAPYLEAGVGAHVLTKSSVGAERRFGTLFQFGSHLGAGLRFGEKRAFDIAYRYQHLSNASIKEPNQGINFHLVRLQYHF